MRFAFYTEDEKDPCLPDIHHYFLQPTILLYMDGLAQKTVDRAYHPGYTDLALSNPPFFVVD
jgi:hypothetical protein